MARQLDGKLTVKANQLIFFFFLLDYSGAVSRLIKVSSD